MTPSVLTELTAAGVRLWLDDLSRARLARDLQRLVRERAISGVTTNPTIFEKAIAGASDDYAAQVRELRASGADIDAAIRTLTTDDVRAAWMQHENRGFTGARGICPVGQFTVMDQSTVSPVFRSRGPASRDSESKKQCKKSKTFKNRLSLLLPFY